jgi:S-DNA-T family DNA segregation ATPase FtsK/SpoIIIE
MAKKKQILQKETIPAEEKSSVFSFLKTRQAQTILGFFLMLFSLFLCIAFISFFFSWQEDQSDLNQLSNRALKSKNLLGKIGASLSHFFIYKGFGLAAFTIAFQIFLSGFYILIKRKFSKIIISWNWGLIAMLWISVALGFLHKKYALLSGVIGFEINDFVQTFIGKTGLVILLAFLFIAYVIIRYKVTLDAFIENMKQKRIERKENKLAEKEHQAIEEVAQKSVAKETKKEIVSEVAPKKEEEKKNKSEFELSLENLKPTISKHSDVTSKK